MQNENQQLEKEFRAVVEQHLLISATDTILAGISAGSDSTALLSLLCTVVEAKRIVAVYVDHGLRPDEAKREASSLRELCCRLGVFFITTEAAVQEHASQSGQSIEEAARFLRYRAFHRLALENGCEKIAVGHTADDQVENFFIRLIRGAGMGAMKGMLPRSGTIIRPLLGFSKKRLRHYLIANNIRWLEDSSNQEIRFLRNKVRLQLLPLLQKEFSPAIARQVLQLMAIAKEEDDFLNRQVAELWPHLIIWQEGNPPALLLSRTAFTKEHTALQRRIVEKCCIQMGRAATFTHIEQVIRLIIENKKGELHLPGGLRVERQREDILFHYPLTGGETRGSGKKKPDAFQLAIPQPGSYPLPGGGGLSQRSIKIEKRKTGKSKTPQPDLRQEILVLDFAAIRFPLSLRSPLPGDRFFPCNGRGSKKISRFLSEKKIPPAARQSWPLLVSDGQIAAVAGLTIDNRFKATAATTTLLTLEYSTPKKHS